MMNFIKALPVIAVLVLLKYLQIRLMKSQIRSYLHNIHAKDVVIKFEKMEYRYDIYHVMYSLDGEMVEKHVICSLFSRMRWM